MDIQPGEFAARCYCGKSFSQPGALSNHTRTCQKSNKRLSSALASAKNSWEVRQNTKRQKLNPIPQLLDVEPLSKEVLDHIVVITQPQQVPETVRDNVF